MAEYRAIRTQLIADGITFPVTASVPVLDFKSTTVTTYMRNFTNAPLYLTIYHYTHRDDTDTAAAGPSILFYSALQAWLNGVTTTGDDLRIGNTPFASNLFTAHYNVRKVTHKTLSPGGFTRWRMKFPAYQLSMSAFINNIAAPSEVGKGHFTTGKLVVVHGGVSIVNGGGGLPTFSAGKLATLTVTNYKLRNTQDWLPDVTVWRQINAPATGAGAITDYALSGSTAVAVVP